jgi:hypothetical protein
MPAAAIPKRSKEPLQKETALGEAGRLLEEAYSLGIPAPDGRLFWGYVFEGGSSFRFCDAGLTGGLSGFAAFAAAYLDVGEDGRVRRMAQKIIQETVLDLGRAMEHIRFRDFSFDFSPPLGESSGTAGIITALELIRNYVPRQESDAFDACIDELLAVKITRAGACVKLCSAEVDLVRACNHGGAQGIKAARGRKQVRHISNTGCA